ncbi:23S rRNA (adenine(2503)-C(2))-methyltransferase RlmN [Patescibacteria group bacterium]|nr:23S rRNA (adenine(2503)-C(2))-methyltransferase RlmN [Patescibacteria group bacterium]
MVFLENVEGVLKGEPAYRVKQAKEAVFKQFISDWGEAKNLPAGLRKALEEKCPLEIEAEFFESGDGQTVKALVDLDDGEKIETVLMKETVCVSCQVGCGMGCDFCATGKMGFKRNLSVDEIVEQVLLFLRKGKQVSHVVFMGMGEPFLNYENVIFAAKVFNEDLGIAARKISVSTCGIVPGIKKFADEKMQMNLAISLHASNSELRDKFMPVNKRFSMGDVLDAVREYIEKTGRKVMIEYVLLKGVNDNMAQAKELGKLLKSKLRHLFMVNLIVYNSTGGNYLRPESKRVSDFRKALESEGITVTQRFRMGHDIEGACGQLRARH